MNVNRESRIFRWGGGVLIATLLLLPSARAANPDGDLRVEIITAYNLVVDSNAESPSTYAPKSAYIGAKFCNEGTDALTNVWAYIGNYDAGTPGIYPSRAHPGLTGPLPGGEFALTHEGGNMGTRDATRFIGTLEPGACVTVYWLVSYPQLDENDNAVWGDSVKPDDDLWMEYDVWATAQDGAAYREADDTRTMTCRNEISAMANKIWPNGANKVPQEYQDLLQQYAPLWTNTSATAEPGAILRTEGIWYDLGNIGDGFDNDGDLVPDRNAWLQPVGDPDLFDPSCFRLVRTYVMIIVKLNDGTEQVIIVEDQLYFTQIPPDNRGAVGYVMYEFIAVGSGCVSTLTPYQEVASGFDNEKFNGDYGAPGQTLTGGTSLLAIAKSANPLVTRPGSNIAYTVTYTNSGPDPSGRPDIGLPLVVQDSIPTGTLYVAGSATPSNVLPSGVTAYAVYFSTNHGATWTLTEPAAATNVTDIQWWLSDPLPPGGAGIVRFSVTVKNPWPFPSPIVLNTAGLSFGNTAPFLTADAQTLLIGDNTLGDLVWRDDGAGGGYLGNQLRDGGETGISNVTVRVYYDANSNGVVEAWAGDFLVSTVQSGTNGIYYATNLPDGYFVVEVDVFDADIPFGYTPTTPTSWSIGLDPARTNVNAVTNLTADFGFAPALTLVKTRTSTNAIREGQLISYNLTVSNSLPGDGTGSGSLATYSAWAATGGAKESEWASYTNVYTPPGPDGQYSSNGFQNTTKYLYLSNFVVGVQNGSVSNVDLLLPMVVVQPTGDDDTFTIQVSKLSPASVVYAGTYMATSLVSGTLVVPLTGTTSWAWTDFGTNVQVRLSCNKNAGGAGAGYMLLDAAGFRIQGSVTTGVATTTTTLDPVPLTDVYDPAKLQYVSAQPPVTSSTTNGVGTLYWDNVGPIYPGGTSTVAVTFKLLEPPNNTNTIVTNTTWVTNAYFTSGRRANDATSSVVVTAMPAATVGDYVWRDLNGNGIQDETNMGIANVAVSITPPPGIDLGNGLGAAITNWTDATGYYLFESIPATGTYTVRVVTATLPGGAGVNTYDETGPLDSTAAVYLNIYTNGTNNTHLTTDFGYTLPSTIEGTIWHDYDRGQETYREAGEDWLTNVTVYLCASPSPCGPGASIATNQTDTNGYFRFTGNYTGTYTVLVWTNTGMMSNGNWHISWDTDGTNTANYSSVTVPSGGVGRADFSYYRSGAFRIGDTLFYDWNSNGVQDVASEGGISNVTVHLYEDANGDGVVDIHTDAYIASTVTATNGYYIFTNLFATNTYLVYVDRNDPDLPDNYIVTADPDSIKDARSVVTLTVADRLDQDFGFWPYGNGAIGDTVWRDLNADGIQFGYQETGIANVQVTLYSFENGLDRPLRTTNTSSTGYYLFDDLPDGHYRVVVDAADADLPVDAFGHPYSPTTATYYDVTISGGNTYLDADFGFAPYGAIGDTVFWDLGRDGDQDYNDPGVPGVEVRLYADVNGNRIYDFGETLLASTTTDVNGLYLFDQLPPGNYAVRVVTTSGPLLGADQTADPNSDGLTCEDPELTIPCDDQYGLWLARGQNFMGADFGYAPSGVIGDTLWIDTNNNGVRDTNELGIPYVSVILYSNGTAIATNVTDSDGYYGFSGLVDFSNYGVGVDTGDADFPAGLTNTWTADGTYDNYTTNIVMSGSSVTSIGGLPCTGCDLNVDFGYRYAGNNSLSGTIGLDATPYDGLMNGMNPSGPGPGESAYSGVPVTLYLWDDDGDGILESGEYVQIGSTTTDANGDYAFTGLPNGDGNDQYVVASPAPESYLTLTTTNGSIPSVTVSVTTNTQGYAVSARLTIGISPSITNMDFAYASSKSYDYGDLPDSYQTTAPDGARHLLPATANLYLGSGVDAEPNGQPSAGADGDDLAGMDDEDGVLQLTNAIWRVGAEGGSVQVTVGAGSGWLFGYIDFNGDGDFVDAGEMVCSLVVSNTGGNGTGVYTNAFTVPAGTFSTTSATPLYARFRLFPEEPLFSELAFAGTAANGEVEDYLWHLAGIGDYVWYDYNEDGVQDTNEPPIPGVRVFLDLNDDGSYQTNEPAATTDSAGLYGIGGLIPGAYTVRVDTNTLPAGVLPTYDYDGTGTPHEAAIAITNLNQFFDAADFGYLPPVDIGDRVWFDANRDGIQNPNEADNFVGIGVALLDTNGNIVAETVTDDNGLYLFEKMPARTYFLRFDLTSISTNENISPTKVGGDDNLDSDVIIGNVGDYAWTGEVAPVAGETKLTVDLGITTRGPTRAELAGVWGEWVDGQGRVAWRTDSEFGTAGFFVYRVDPETGAETRLNNRLQPAAFQENGSVYALADPAAQEGTEGRYRLEELEFTGGRRDLGAHTVVFSASPPSVPAVQAASTTSARRTAARAIGISSVLKVRIHQEGVYGISLQAVASGMGRSLAEVQVLAEAGQLQLTRQGEAVPVIYDAARSRLVFHGSAPESNWYVHESVYLLAEGAGLDMPRRDPGATSGATVFPVQLHFEENLFLFSMNEMPADFYFWAGVISGFDDLSVQSFPLDLTGHAGGDVRLKVRLMGWTSSTNHPDHLAKFGFNGVEVGTIAFDGQEAAEAELTIPAAAVVDGVNMFTVEGVLQPGRSESFFVVDWIEAGFERVLMPAANTLHFRAGGAATVSAAAFAEPLALALNETGAPTWLADETGVLPGKAWAAVRPDERFAAVEAEAVVMLAPDPAAADAWFLAADNEVDYLVIAPAALAAAAQELVDYRASQGLQARLAVFEDMCDLLAGGVRTPEAIPALLRRAVATWTRAPGMVVLAGNGHYDYLGANTGEANHLPPLLVQTPAGVCASDGLLADTGGDSLPDLAIGRLPARTGMELAAMIAKIQAYESGFGAAWQNELLLAADKADSIASFSAANDRLAVLAAAPYSVPARIDLDQMELAAARPNFLDWFQAGAGFIHYTGHGGMKTLGAQTLLSWTNVAAMNNATRPPIVVTLTCLAARYEVPGADSLGELMLQRAQGGAVAMLGPAGLSQNAPATELGEAFYRAILQEGVGRLGLAFLRARRSLPASLFADGTYAVYNLLGDPALRIAGNPASSPAGTAAQIVLSDLAQVYNGQPHAVTATTVPPGLMVKITYEGSSTPPTAAGRYAVTATAATADSEGSATGLLIVAKAPATVLLSGLAQTYDGNPRAVSAVTTPAGLAVDLTYDGQSEPPTEPGTYAVAAAVADANYEGTATGLLTVAQAAATLTLGHLAQVFDGEPREISATVSPAGLPVTVTYNGRPEPPVNAGRYAVVATVEDVNYAGMAAGTLVVEKAHAEIVLGNLTQTYDGQPRYATATTVPDELAVDFTFNGSPAVPRAAGSYAVVGTVSDANWQGVATGTLTVGRGSQTITFPAIGDRLSTDVVTLSAKASSGLPVTYAVAAGPGLISGGNTLSFTGAGEVTVVAAQAGDANWAAAPEVASTFQVGTLLVSATHFNVRENGEGRFFIRLCQAPASNLVLTVSRVSGSSNLWVKSGASVAFTPLNWETWRSITVAASDDADSLGETAVFRITIPGMADRFVTAATLDDDIGPNVALAAAGATIKGTKASLADLIIDGVHTSSANYGYTIWTNDPPGTVTLDLNGEIPVSRVRLLNWNWTSRTQRYLIESSVDGGDWSLLVDAAGEDHQGWDEWEMPPQRARYLRITGLFGSVNQCFVLSELEVFGTPGTLPHLELSKTAVNVHEAGEGRFFVRLPAAPAAPVMVTVTPVAGTPGLTLQSGAVRSFTAANWNAWQAVTLAAAPDDNAAAETTVFRISAPGYADQLVTATTLDDDIGPNVALASAGVTVKGYKAIQAAQVIDGMHASSVNYGYTIWTNDPPGTLTLDLKQAVAITRVRLLNWDWVYRVHRYLIEASPDGLNWSVLADARGEDHQGWDDWAVQQTARYLRFTGVSNSANQCVVVSELEVLGAPVVARRGVSSGTTVASQGGQVLPVLVETSDGQQDSASGWAAADGDLASVWTGTTGAGGWYIVLGYDPPLDMTNLVVHLADGSATELHYLHSMDAVEWHDLAVDLASQPMVELRYLWLVFPSQGAGSPAPAVQEIIPQLQQ